MINKRTFSQDLYRGKSSYIRTQIRELVDYQLIYPNLFSKEPKKFIHDMSVKLNWVEAKELHNKKAFLFVTERMENYLNALHKQLYRRLNE